MADVVGCTNCYGFGSTPRHGTCSKCHGKGVRQVIPALRIDPCPFCNGRGCYVDDGHYGFVECNDCGAKSGGYVFDDTADPIENRNSTINEQWNKRVHK